MFLLFFLVFTLIFTLFENIFFACIIFICALTWLVIYQFIQNKKILSSKIIYLFAGWFLLAGIAFCIKEWRYYAGMPQPQKIIIGTGTVSDISSQGKYVFEYQNSDYLLYSKKEYAIGQQIRIVGRKKENIKKDGFSYRNISRWTFDIPLFSGSFDFEKWMKMKWRKGTIYEDNSSTINGWDMGIGWIRTIKRWIQEKIISVYGKNRISWLVLGMVIGDRSQIPESEYQSFINSGLVHLVAVSWGNILMIVLFLQFILFFLPFYVRLGLIFFTIIGYSLICWLDSSVFRAAIMWGLNMLALFWGREINIWRLLSISCIVMLLINPYFLAYDTGFLLSYTALIGIVYFQKDDKLILAANKQEIITTNWEIKKEKNHIKRWLQYVYKNYIEPSIWASLGIFPIIIFFMGNINILGFIGNLFVLPIVPFVMIYGFISVYLYRLLWWKCLLWIEHFWITYIYKISDIFSQYGIYFMVSWLRLKFLILLLFAFFFLIRKIGYRSQEKAGKGRQ